MPRKRKGLPINGIILIDKPAGMSSNAVVQTVKRLFNAQKAGHTGALDPLATGLLPVCLGEATKFSQFLLEADKAYQTTAILGQRTDTSDADGEIVSQREVRCSENELKVALTQFTGTFAQTPSMYSALKYEGRPLYHYARKGIEVPRPTRMVKVHELTLLSFQDNLLSLEIACSKGTYIRTIVDDLGEALGCGAHVSQLRRLWISGFKAHPMHTLDALSLLHESKDIEGLHSHLLPMDVHMTHIPHLMLDHDNSVLFSHGAQINAQCVGQMNVEKNQNIRVYNEVNQRFLGIAFIREDGLLQPKRLVVYPVE